MQLHLVLTLNCGKHFCFNTQKHISYFCLSQEFLI